MFSGLFGWVPHRENPHTNVGSGWWRGDFNWVDLGASVTGVTMKKSLSKERKTKHVSLSAKAIEDIGRFAKKHGMTFSDAIEKLAKASLPGEEGGGVLALIETAVRYEMGKQFNRFAKLHAFTAMEAGTAKEITSAVMMWTLHERYKDYTDQLRPGQSVSLSDFEKFAGLSGDSEKAILGAAHKKRSSMYRVRAVKALRSPMEEFEELLSELSVAMADEETD